MNTNSNEKNTDKMVILVVPVSDTVLCSKEEEIDETIGDDTMETIEEDIEETIEEEVDEITEEISWPLEYAKKFSTLRDLIESITEDGGELSPIPLEKVNKKALNYAFKLIEKYINVSKEECESTTSWIDKTFDKNFYLNVINSQENKPKSKKFNLDMPTDLFNLGNVVDYLGSEVLVQSFTLFVSDYINNSTMKREEVLAFLIQKDPTEGMTPEQLEKYNKKNEWMKTTPDIGADVYERLDIFLKLEKNKRTDIPEPDYDDSDDEGEKTTSTSTSTTTTGTGTGTETMITAN